MRSARISASTTTRAIASAARQVSATVTDRLALTSTESRSTIQLAMLASVTCSGNQRRLAATASGIGSRRHDGRSAHSSALVRP